MSKMKEAKTLKVNYLNPKKGSKTRICPVQNLHKCPCVSEKDAHIFAARNRASKFKFSVKMKNQFLAMPTRCQKWPRKCGGPRKKDKRGLHMSIEKN